MPDELWTETLEPSMLEAVENFKKYEDKINKQVYLSDMSRTLMSFGFRALGSNKFLSKIETFFESNLNNLDGKTCENLLFFLMRCDT